VTPEQRAERLFGEGGHDRGCPRRTLIDGAVPADAVCDCGLRHDLVAVATEIRAAAEEEREACAKVAQDRAESLFAWMSKLPIGTPDRVEKSLRSGECSEIAKAIRARGRQ